ncbi:hypothetical protein JCM19239_4320 [Vibrio variabilis]|uniref:Uncharacterized protein n=1 Tax=Vibrio variabilis TaxID=990271 RepID=A0ABQ0JDY7_9VIBR|nr:hypothetical protein JCM19239_4320 [Vibrio variabilis]
MLRLVVGLALSPEFVGATDWCESFFKQTLAMKPMIRISFP